VRINKIISVLWTLSFLGLSAQAATLLSDTTGQARRPQIAFANGIIHTVDFEDQNIIYRRSLNRGATWEPKIEIGDASTDWNPVLAAHGSMVYLAWWSDRNVKSISEVYFVRSTNNGASFEAPQLLSPNDRNASYVTGLDASADGSHVTVAYWDQRSINGVAHTNIFTRTSAGFGAVGSWITERLANDPARILDYQNPSLDYLPDGRIGILFQANPLGFPTGGLAPYSIQFTQSVDGGASFFPEANFLSTPRPTVFASALFPNCVVDAQGILHAAWYETRGGRNVFYSRSTDGLVWSKPLQISDHQPYDSLGADLKPGRPGIVAFSNRVEIYWARTERNIPIGDGAGALFRAISTDNGFTFGSQITVVPTNGNSHPSVATDGTNIYLIYSADRGGDRLDVYFDVIPAVTVPLLDWLGLLVVLAGFSLLMRAGNRRGTARVLATVALLFALRTGAQAQTIVAQPLPIAGGTVNDLYRTSSGSLFAATEGGGIYTSADSGANWRPINSGLGNLFVSSVDGNGTNIILAGTQQGVYRSVNSGASWEFEVPGRISSVKVVPGRVSEAFAGVLGGGVLRSTDSGATWRSSGIAGLQSLNVTSVDVGGGRVWIGTNGKGVHVSSDNGANWQRKTAGLESFADAPYISKLVIDLADPNIVYFGTLGEQAPAALNIFGGDVYITRNAGGSWGKYNTAEAFFGVTGLSISGGRLFVGTNQIGIFATAGPASSGTFTKILAAVNGRDVVADSTGANLWAALRGAGVYRSTNAGVAFSASSQGLHAFTVRDIAVQGANIFLGVAGGIQRSTNSGASFGWANVGMGQNGNSLTVDVQAVTAGPEGRVYAASRFDGFYSSDNSGATWIKRAPDDTPNIYAIAIGKTKDNVLAGSRTGVLHVSGNGGATWTNVSLGEPKAFISSIVVNPSDPTAALVATYNQRSFATTNGSNWTLVAQPTSSEYRFTFTEVIILPSLNVQVAATSEGMMTRTNSFGFNPGWVRRLGGLQDSYFSAVVSKPGNPSKVVAAAYNSGLYVSEDAGLSWRKVPLQIGSPAIECLAALNASTLLVGTLGAGAYSMPWP